MAQSLKLQPLTSLGTPNNVLSDDYVHGTFETYKFKASTTNGGKVDYKAKVATAQKDGKLAVKVSDEGKIQFPFLDKYTFQFCQRRSGDVKLHFDLGNYTISGKSWNFFTNVKTDTTLSKFNFRLGTNYFGSTCESNTRLELVPGDAPVLTHRNYIKKGSIYYGGVFSLNLQALALKRYDALFGYVNDKYEANLKHESDNKDTKDLQVGTLTATVSYFHDANTKLALEVQNKGHKLQPTFTVGAQRKVNSDLTVKGKVNNKLDLSLASKYALNRQFTLTAGLQLALNEKNIVDFSKFPPVPFGLQLETNF
ncbi:eukaryotic porin protein (macronuclear) [Tetrahymena thermophila SB210]|uniref:Eukaryotic porin protein n=1 Tax=Tetrahymena thermophila (strain SB210) TaxID=312017 RepID=Q22Z08_TETTS|nr:eukaryotic porin protein [Tetrahymena thermophila SB210]EAR90513.2 eukaryotic porin protein [Tetrahymena thermophila SB210]|eukprot:XP_001010758.2 eukaryotic porin protein [Tetrahymena thermophila SB210]